MSLAGLKKQFNKANQYMSEKMGSAEPTPLDEEFREMERKTDVTAELIENLILRTKEYLQPNPASRTKMSTMNSYAKMRGQAKQHAYPQPEGILGDTMCKYGGDLGVESVFGHSLIEAGEALRQMAEVKYALEDQVRQSFLEPLHQLQTKDIKDLLFHRKKLEGRRLDFDCKKRKRVGAGAGGGKDQHENPNAGVHSGRRGGGVTEEEIRSAEEKFVESKALAETAMYTLLDNEVEQVSQLVALVEAQVEYHRQNTTILESLLNTLYSKRDEASQKGPREPRAPRPPPATTPSTTFNDASPFNEGDREDEENGYLDANQWAGGVTASPARSPSPLPSPVNARAGVPVAARQPMTADTPIAFGASLVPPPKQSTQQHQQQPASAPAASPPVVTYSNIYPTNNGNGGSDFVTTLQQEKPKASCKAVYDFEPENDGELAFSEGDIITLIDRIDDNWFEGSVKGKTGVFPVSYVEIVVDLPKK